METYLAMLMINQLCTTQKTEPQMGGIKNIDSETSSFQ